MLLVGIGAILGAVIGIVISTVELIKARCWDRYLEDLRRETL